MIYLITLTTITQHQLTMYVSFALHNRLIGPTSSLCPSFYCMRFSKEMNFEGDSGLSVSCGNGKLRQWLIDQIDSSIYPGLVWENEEKSIFRIPWKHAGKQDYNRDEDAALFKVR